ncbi:SusC/RagA family TonB-linked outer membrane protein [Dyadobacter fermentans]|uniref:TonB-dependent receptor plug n=1 Tax=Dyadobacter fermentans (strain ATCC 700827 / DSM 18053 / CIP 107007 / KCTC 52180 / NS114) TaxID=471854 RepID=C6VT90_DYAFD|nr:TonB-dependent receptor [Dyadobacter fermentans]ACT96454.1 TonB-dependent receptor plug [Dyadobacter fermentans DSM 18053]
MKQEKLYQLRIAVFLLIALCLGQTARVEAQTSKEIKGVVLDSLSQTALPGVSVVLKGTTSVGTTTDANGAYSLALPTDASALVFSFVGYASQEITIGNSSNINVNLRPDSQALNEIVVTGYSSQRKQDITGSVSVVDMKALKSVPAGSAVQALQGQAAGVNVISSGVPGASSNIFIRGVTSFGNTQPLVIVDGIQADLNNISADDIESVQVLKDAGAAAIYGVRGANGVIVVTTKKGKSGQPTVTYDGYVGVQRPLQGNPFDLLNSEDYMKVVNIANPNNSLFRNGMPDYLYAGPGVAGVAKEGDPAVDPSKYFLDPINTSKNYLIQKVNKQGTDWFHELFKPAIMTNHNLAVSGGNEKASYLFSLGYIHQKGTLIETYLKRYSARINTEYRISKRIKVGENVNIFHVDNPGFGNQSEFGTLSAVYKMMPIVPVYDIRGNFGGTFAGPDLGSNQNPVAQQKRTLNNRNSSWNIVGNAYAEVEILKNLTARTSFGVNINNPYSQSFNYTQYDNKQGNSSPNSYSESASYNNMITWTNTLGYNRQFGKHSLQVLLGSESIKSMGRSVGGASQRFFSTEFDYLILGNGTSGVTNFSNAYVNSLFSIFSRVDYAFQDKYLIGATIRRDGSSRFGSRSRYGTFPSVSLGWRLSGEEFMKSVNWLNDLKLRASYGVLGSQNNVAPENAYTLFGGGYGNAYYDITGSSNSVKQGFIQTRIGNPNASWEENVVTNIGLDATILNNSLDFSFEYYKKSINGLLFTQPLPATVGGAAAPVVNIGDIQNKGFDVALTYRGRVGNGLQYSIGTNITAYKNLVVDIPSPGYFDGVSQQGMGTLVRNKQGEEVSSFFGYEVIKLFNSDQEVAEAPAQTGAAPGRFRYRDVNGDGVITPEDRTMLGSPNPDFTYGLNLGLNFKGFDFSAIFYGSQGAEIVNTIRSYTHFYAGYIGNKSNALLNAWTPENTNTTVPKIETGATLSTSGALNSYFIEDGSYLRLRSLILGYTIKPGILQKIKVSKLRLYAQAANLFTITKYSGLDPELGGSSSSFGVDYGNYPNNQQNFLFGVNLSF